MDGKREFIQRVKKYIQVNDMIRPGDQVLTAVSGGADSVCLLLALAALTQELEFTLSVMHVHHGIRETAQRDAEFVEALCERMHIPFWLERVDVPSYVRAESLTEEEAARALRYAALGQRAELLGGAKIAVAHNENDQAETVLLNLFRGSGLRGIQGILPVRGSVIRPLLECSRTEIEAFLDACGADYVTDETNLVDEHTRNRIRHHILPLAGSMVNTRATEHVAAAAREAAMAQSYLQRQGEMLLTQCLKREDPLELELSFWRAQEPVLRRYILIALLAHATENCKDITSAHLEALDRMCMERAGSMELDLPYGVRAVRQYDLLLLQTGGGEKALRRQQAQGSLVQPPGLQIHVFDRPADQIIPNEKYTKWFDYDRIQGTLGLRTRREGDCIVIDDAGHTQTIKKFMIDAKIPAKERDTMLLVADDVAVIWIPGYRMNAAYKVREDTQQIVEVVYNRSLD